MTCSRVVTVAILLAPCGVAAPVAGPPATAHKQAAAWCSAAFGTPAPPPCTATTLGPPLLVLRSVGSGPWSARPEDQLRLGGPPGPTPNAVACIRDTNTLSGQKYTDGAAAHDRKWEIELLDAQGRRVSHIDFKESAPTVKSGPGAGYAPAPRERSVQWLRDLAGNTSIAFCASSQLESPLALSPDRATFVSRSISLWTVAGWKLRAGIKAPSVRSVAFLPDGKTFLTVGESAVEVRDAAAGDVLRTLPSSLKYAGKVAVRPDGKAVVLAPTIKGRLAVLDLEAGTETDGPPVEGQPFELAFSSTGDRFAIAVFRQPVRLWNPAGWTKVADISTASSMIKALAFSPDGSQLAIGDDKVTLVVDAATGRELRRLDEAGYGTVHALAFDPASARLATAPTQDSINLWDTQSWEKTRTIGNLPHGSVDRLFFVSDRELLSVSSEGVGRRVDITARPPARTPARK